MTALDDADLQSLEKFVVVMYDRSSADIIVNETRLNLFARKQRLYDAIPPTQSAHKVYIQSVLSTKEELPGVKPLPRPVTKSLTDS